MCDKLGQSFALLPCRSKPWIWIAKPSECSVQKFIGGRGVPASALPVEGPAKNELRRAILFSSHASEPMVDQRGFSDSAPGNDGNDVGILVCPCTVQERDVLLSTKQITSGNG